MWSFAATFVTWLLGLIRGSKQATTEQMAASNATAQTELTQEENADANLAQASAARSAADAASLSIVTKPGATNADTIAALKAKFPDAYR